MKTILKITTALLCLQFLATTTFAQASKKTFTGIWELAQAAANGQPLQNSPHGFLKTFNSNGTFANVQMRNTGALISHSGKYFVKDGYYLERTLYRIPQMSGGPLGKDFKISYQFSEDQKQVTFNFTVESGMKITEVWRKL